MQELVTETSEHPTVTAARPFPYISVLCKQHFNGLNDESVAAVPTGPAKPVQPSGRCGPRLMVR
jgi:hypothetical protein